MALIGALIGVVLGAAFGWLAVGSAIPGAVLGFPVVRVGAFVLVAALAGILAAFLPGRRAAKTLDRGVPRSRVITRAPRTVPGAVRGVRGPEVGCGRHRPVPEQDWNE